MCYGILIWGTMMKQEDRLRLKKLQDKCVKLINPRKSIQEIYKGHRILKLDELVELEQLKTWYKYYNQMLPQKLMKMMKEDQNKSNLEKQHQYNTRRKKELNLPFATTTLYRNSFYIQGCKSYSDLPPEIKEIKNYHLFVKKCKILLMDRY